jgi:hypothetical protein
MNERSVPPGYRHAPWYLYGVTNKLSRFLDFTPDIL